MTNYVTRNPPQAASGHYPKQDSELVYGRPGGLGCARPDAIGLKDAFRRVAQSHALSCPLLSTPQFASNASKRMIPPTFRQDNDSSWTQGLESLRRSERAIFRKTLCLKAEVRIEVWD
jgi:hypothetical protein